MTTSSCSCSRRTRTSARASTTCGAWPTPSTRRCEMRRAAALLLLALWAFAAPGAPVHAQNAQDGADDTVQLKSDLVVVPVAVRHEKGGTVMDMRQEELSLSEDGIAREISFFNRDTAPVDVVLLVDSSGSVDGVLDVIQAAALSFAKQLRPEDGFSILSFNERPVILLDWSTDLKAGAA